MRKSLYITINPTFFVVAFLIFVVVLMRWPSLYAKPAIPASCTANCSGWGYVQWNDRGNDNGIGASGCGFYSSYPRINNINGHPWQINVRCDDYNVGLNDQIEAGIISYNSSFCGNGIWAFWDTTVSGSFSLHCVGMAGHYPSTYDSLQFYVSPGSNSPNNDEYDVSIIDATTGYLYCNSTSCRGISSQWSAGQWTENSVREHVDSWQSNDYLSASLWRGYWADRNDNYYLEGTDGTVSGANPPTAGYKPNTSTEYTCADTNGCDWNSNAPSSMQWPYGNSPMKLFKP